MLFNSFAFFIFLASVLGCCLLLGHAGQNRLLLAASLFFYGTWDWRFLALLLATAAVGHWTARLIHASSDEKVGKRILAAGILFHMGMLCWFKYFNFFAEQARLLLSGLGLATTPAVLQIALPAGISFYVFQSMGCTIDVFRKKIKPAASFFDYALYLSFFPQLLAGPIARGGQLLPQIAAPRQLSFKKMQFGCHCLFSGLFLKVFVADNLARMVDPVFSAQTPQSGFLLLLAGYGFAFQIYGDFAGYSWMAKGMAAMLGFELADNFRLPYFATNPQQFWRRWHVSLSTWLRDYLYIPLGGSRGGRARTSFNLLLTMILGGLWHGAKTTFIAWGAFHGLLLVAQHLFARRSEEKMPKAGWTARLLKLASIVCFFHLVVVGWYFFRAESIGQAFAIFEALLFRFDVDFAANKLFLTKLLLHVLPLLTMQVLQHHADDQFAVLRLPVPLRALIYCAAFYLVVIFGAANAQEFIYFQF